MRIRKSARVVLVNERGEVFLFRHSGLLRSYWVLPGGGFEDGETWEAAAIREMWEETGISGVPLGPLLWTRQAHDRHQGEEVIQDERYYLVRCGMPEVTSEHQLDEEKRLYTRSRWWSLEAIRQSSETLYPERLADLLLPVIEGRISPSPLRLPE
jgi:8-oxo-dGTP pyrophosphatase MutT (NUDIX family)